MTGKILIKCDLVVRTGLHIGGSSSFSAIGTVDSPVIRDPFTGLPIVPGSSLKGKLRTLLARRSCVNGETLPDFSADGEVLLRMFGGSEPVRFARLQFADAFLLNYDQLKGVGVTEVKSENTINRLTSKANPRQIERIVAGARFGVNIVYNLSDPQRDGRGPFASVQGHEAAPAGLPWRARLPRQRPCELPELPGDPLPGDAER